MYSGGGSILFDTNIHSWISIEQLPEKTISIIDTTHTVVHDQTTSGYMDIGNMRIQWGKAAPTAGSISNVATFPVPFKNNSYVLNTSLAPGTSHTYSIYTTSPQIDRFTFGIAGSNWVASSTIMMHWVAIGEKP